MKVRLAKGRARPFWHGNPLVFSGAVASVEGDPAAGDWVEVVDAEDRRIGWGWFHPTSLYRVRLARWASEEGLPEDPAGVIRTRIERAVAVRRALGIPSPDCTAWRVVHSEGDGISGLSVDLLGDVAVASDTAFWTERYRTEIDAILRDVAGSREVVHRVPPALRREEGMAALPEAPDRDPVEVLEGGLRLLADPWKGQKTGFYCDQRENRALVRRLATGRRVLDLYCHSGAFALQAAAGGAREVLAVDTSAPALALGREAAARNGLPVQFLQADVREVLARDDRWDLVVCDPPKLAASRGDLPAAAERYLHLNRAAMERVGPGGLLLTCSCSAAMRRDLFLEVLRDAAARAHRRVRLLEVRGAGPDHPVHPAFPEGEYLKAVLLSLE
ncbi:MAG TPA: class I SAM-dependent rRNA methyltransferase [Myxococcota bacterium]|nr:class I SAM-dependent rRNA methyltransferase [Myxococcota bacterium]HQK52089.1 class I SAM-dependent rRNA methyltransferase [Myxococcota bacterium]